MRPWDDPAPGEREAGDRSWDIVRDAYEERIRVPRKRDWRPIAIAATAAVVVARSRHSTWTRRLWIAARRGARRAECRAGAVLAADGRIPACS